MRYAWIVYHVVPSADMKEGHSGSAPVGQALKVVSRPRVHQLHRCGARKVCGAKEGQRHACLLLGGPLLSASQIYDADARRSLLLLLLTLPQAEVGRLHIQVHLRNNTPAAGEGVQESDIQCRTSELVSAADWQVHQCLAAAVPFRSDLLKAKPRMRTSECTMSSGEGILLSVKSHTAKPSMDR